MWTSVRPAGGGSVRVFCGAAVPAVLPGLLAVVSAPLVGLSWTGIVELGALSVDGVDEASAGGGELNVSTGDVDAVSESVDVATTCARTGLTMAKPTASTTTIALAPTNVMVLVFIQLFICQ